VGINSGGVYSRKLLKEINVEGLEKDFNVLNLKEFETLPDWIVEARKEIAKEKPPVFSYYADDYIQYELEVYADGIVKIGFGSTGNGFSGHELGDISFVDVKKDFWIKVPPSKIKSFLIQLKKIGFYKWELNNQIPTFCDAPDPSQCLPKQYQIVVRNGQVSRRVYLSGLVWNIAKIGVGREKETVVTERIGKVSALVEKYFPTQSLRCSLGASNGYMNECVLRDSRWKKLFDGRPV
jgi:hypothetical protein